MRGWGRAALAVCRTAVALAAAPRRPAAAAAAAAAAQPRPPPRVRLEPQEDEPRQLPQDDRLQERGHPRATDAPVINVQSHYGKPRGEGY